jgi:hypothetical protein
MSISIRELADASATSEKTLRRYVGLGMPCAQIGRAATERGTQAIPYLFDREASLDWIEEYRAAAEAARSSPYIERLTPQDPRHEAAVTATLRAETQIQEILDGYISRQHIALETAADFERIRRILLKLPRDLSARIAKLIGKDRHKIEAVLREEISHAISGLRVENIFADSPPMRPEILGVVEPLSDLDQEDDLDIPTAKRYAPSDPRHRQVQARTARAQLEMAIERGVLLPSDTITMTFSTILGEMNSMLRAVGGSVAQRLASDRADVSRKVKDEIDAAIFATYRTINGHELSDLDFAEENTGDEL